MAPGKAPAFQFYPKDFLTDERVRLMTHTERGIYITLLCLCWLEHSLPTRVEALAKLVEVPAPRFTKLWGGPLSACFFEQDGRLYHKRLEEERDKQEHFRRRQSDNGKRGGRPVGSVLETQTKPMGFENETQTQAKKSSPISDLRSADSSLSSERDELTERAGRLREELYPQWYAKHRHGARLRLMANSLEYQDALSLVRTWDDARLEKLARIVLTTDDDWISRTDRSFRIFAMKASWADDKLREWEKTHGVAV